MSYSEDKLNKRIEQAQAALDVWRDAFDPPLTHLQSCMVLNVLFELQRIQVKDMLSESRDVASGLAKSD